MEEIPPRNAKEYYDKYLKGTDYRTSYNESVGNLEYEKLGPFIQKEIITEFRKWKKNRSSLYEKQEKNVEREELFIVPEEGIQEEKKEVSFVDEIVSQLNSDEEYLKVIATTIMNREQTQTDIMQETEAKHDPESFEIWKKLPYGLSWGEKKKLLDQQDVNALEKSFGSLDKAKMKINRENFIVAEKIILNDPIAKAKNVCKTGSIKITKDEDNKKFPYSIQCTMQENRLTGTLYTKNKESKLDEPELLYKIYVTVNISDIIEKIKKSKEKNWNKKKMDWDQKHEGRMTTITPTQ